MVRWASDRTSTTPLPNHGRSMDNHDLGTPYLGSTMASDSRPLHPASPTWIPNLAWERPRWRSSRWPQAGEAITRQPSLLARWRREQGGRRRPVPTHERALSTIHPACACIYRHACRGRRPLRAAELEPCRGCFPPPRATPRNEGEGWRADENLGFHRTVAFFRPPPPCLGLLRSSRAGGDDAKMRPSSGGLPALLASSVEARPVL